jgi:hypothetical protein
MSKMKINKTAEQPMKKTLNYFMDGLLILLFLAGSVSAAGKMAKDDIDDHDKASIGRIGDLIHESVVDGYMLAYHFLDLRDPKSDGMDKATMDRTSAMTNKEMEKPHHLMVYIMDKNHKLVLKGKVGFLIKDPEGNSQEAMGMYMSRGFGTTADMMKKGVYNISMKAILGDKRIMDNFKHEMK